ncbi:MAG: HD domain-containing protein [Promethearchaeota archaeon]
MSMEEKKNSENSLMDFINPPQRTQEISLSPFMNKDIIRLSTIPFHNFDLFFEIAKLDEITRKELKFILNDTKELPAALGNYHGTYPGGLFDHTLLVVNYTNYICKSLKDQTLTRKVILTAICHDFGKIPYYGMKLGLKNRSVNITMDEADIVRSEITERFNLIGKDRHVENAIAVIKRYLSKFDLLFDDEMYIGLIFHHGSWSKYLPNEMNELASIIHVADMIASQVFKI